MDWGQIFETIQYALCHRKFSYMINQKFMKLCTLQDPNMKMSTLVGYTSPLRFTPVMLFWTRRMDGSVTISFRNFVGEGIIKSIETTQHCLTPWSSELYTTKAVIGKLVYQNLEPYWFSMSKVKVTGSNFWDNSVCTLSSQILLHD
jgi:hypothetical protein